MSEPHVDPPPPFHPEPVANLSDPVPPEIPPELLERGCTPVPFGHGWDAALEQFHSIYALRSPGADLDPSIGPIEEGAEGPIDLGNFTFRFQNVEILLNQAANLVDRCAANQLQRDEYALRRANLAIEVNEFLAKDKIQRDEIRKGLFVTPYKQSFNEWQSLDVYAANLNGIIRYMDQYNDASKRNAYINAMVRGAWASGFPYGSLPDTGPARHLIYGGDNQEVPTHLYKAAKDQATFSMEMLGQSKVVQKYLVATDKSFAAIRRTGWEARRNWDEASIDFNLARVRAAQDTAQTKIDLAIAPGGALNFSDREKSTRERFVRDFRDVISRLAAVAKGLVLLYDYPSPLPRSAWRALPLDGLAELRAIAPALYPESPNPLPALSFDEVVRWIRDAIAWLLRFQQGETIYTLAFGLKQCGLNLPGLAGGAPSGFTLDGQFFQGDGFPRVLGIGLEAVGGSPGYWRLDVRAPLRSVGPGVRAVDQSNLPPARLGRVTQRGSAGFSAIDKSPALHNALPGGDWTVGLAPGPAAPHLQDCDDLVLHLELAGRTH